jgi:hypothetical protein
MLVGGGRSFLELSDQKLEFIQFYVLLLLFIYHVCKVFDEILVRR